MRKTSAAIELTEAEIVLLLREKLRPNREKRLQTYRRTGRAILLVRDFEQAGFSPVSQGREKIDLAGDDRFQPRYKIPFVSNLLGLIELTAVVSLAILLWLGWNSLANLNQRATAAWILPTLTPTPLIQAVVLPDGHTPPNLPGGSRPNEEEVPEHLRPIVQVFANIPTPTSAPHHGVRIQIPALNIDSPLVQGDGWEQLKKGVAQHLGTANPGEKGNMVLSGHNDVYGEVFRYLDRLKPGDEVNIFSSVRSYIYIVEGWTLVDPDQVEVMDPTSDETLTLISCYPYMVNTQRIVV